VERRASIGTTVTVLELLVCVFVINIHSTHAHHCSSTNHPRHRLVIIVVGAIHWIIVSSTWLQAVKVVAKTSNSLARENAENISLMLGEFYRK
jgi:flagellar motor component MotA